ncbi:MAG TPA: hypothetical protein VGI74_12965 [Streptosporangiaceae bacterium]
MLVDLTPVEAVEVWLSRRARLRRFVVNGTKPPPALVAAEHTLYTLLRDADRDAARKRALSAARSRRYRARKRRGQAVADQLAG